MIGFKNLSKRYGQQELLSQQTYHFNAQARTAIVGRNGAGKSTLLRLLGREEIPDHGEICHGAQVNIGYLHQEPNRFPQATVLEEVWNGHGPMARLWRNFCLNPSGDSQEAFFRAGGGEWQAKSKKILMGLGWKNEEAWRKNPLDLSGGWRMRLELAKLFLSEHDVLLLDEPTNHLDLPSLVWMNQFLKNYKGTLIFVTHDQKILEELPDFILEIQNGTVTHYVGNYKNYKEQKSQREDSQLKSLENIEKKQKHLQSFIDRFGAKATKASQAQSRKKALSKLEAEKNQYTLQAFQKPPQISWPAILPSNKLVLNIEEGSTGYEFPLSQGINFSLEKGDKVAVIGSNGAGKSTFLKTLSKKIPPLSGLWRWGDKISLGYFAQDQWDYLDPESTLLDNLLRQGAQGEAVARKILGNFLFSKEDVFKPLKVLSGGEKSRVGLATLLVKNSNLLLLDEPTNHLDLETQDILLEALKDYPGSLIFVSHDQHFINDLCSHIFVLSEKRTACFSGNLENYKTSAEATDFPYVLSQGEPEGEGIEGIPSSENSFKKTLKKELFKWETRIKQLKRKKDAILKNMAENQENSAVFMKLQKDKNQLEKDMDEAETSWLEISEKLSQSFS